MVFITAALWATEWWWCDKTRALEVRNETWRGVGTEQLQNALEGRGNFCSSNPLTYSSMYLYSVCVCISVCVCNAVAAIEVTDWNPSVIKSNGLIDPTKERAQHISLSLSLSHTHTDTCHLSPYELLQEVNHHTSWTTSVETDWSFRHVCLWLRLWSYSWKSLFLIHHPHQRAHNWLTHQWDRHERVRDTQTESKMDRESQ